MDVGHTEALMDDDRRQSERRAPGRAGGRRHSDVKPEWVSVTDYAIIYGLSRSKVYLLLAEGLLRTYAVGELRRIRNAPPNDRTHREEVA